MSRNTSPTPNHPGRWVITRWGGPSVLEWKTITADGNDLPREHALIRIVTAGIAGPDNLMRVGGYIHPACTEPGFTPGYDFVGQVAAIHSSAKEIAVGDWVASMCVIGAHATHAVCPVSQLIRIDESDDPVKVCALPLNYMTAWGMLKRSGLDLPRGSTILVGSAGGGIGTATAQLVHAFDLGLKMIGTCSLSKFDYVRSLGVIPIDRNAPDLVEQVMALTEGKGVDVAYDAVGTPDSLRLSHLATKATGQLICLGLMGEISGDGTSLINGKIDVGEVLAARLLPRMKFWGVGRDYQDVSKDLWMSDFYAILEKVRRGDLDPKLAKCFRLSEAVAANEALVSGSQVKGKMMFIVDEELAMNYDL